MMRTNDGETLTGRTPAELVSELHQLSRTAAATDKDFMTETAKRAYEQTGVWVSDGSPEGFIRGLVEAGLLIEEK